MSWRFDIKELSCAARGSAVAAVWCTHGTAIKLSSSWVKCSETLKVLFWVHIFFPMRAWAPMPIFYITEGSTEYSPWKTEILADPVLVHKSHPTPHHILVTLSRLQLLPHLHSPGVLSCALPPALHEFFNAREKEGLYPWNSSAKAVEEIYSAPCKVQ